MKALSATQVSAGLKKTSGWKLVDGAIEKRFKFEDYYETIAFVNVIAFLANRANHHPDLVVGYNTLTVRFSTHDASGITKKDFAIAGEIDAI